MPRVAPYYSSRVSRKHHLDDEAHHLVSKRRRVSVIDLTGDSPDDEPTPPSKGKARMTTATPPSSKKSASSIKTPERRLRRFRTHAPRTYYEKLQRATTQRMFVISRSRVDAEGALEENVDMVGSVGNIYRVTITYQPSCSCPDGLKGNQCKHIIYVLVNVLKARQDLCYQLAFIASELEEMFANAPLDTKDRSASSETECDGKRKPIEGDCPICFMEFDPKTEKIVWCETSCGNNIHKSCFDQWAATTRQNGVRCVYCRAEWGPSTDTSDLNMESLMSNAIYSEDGYVNVASAVGLSGQRDYSTYNRYWVRRQFGPRRTRYFDRDHYDDYF